MAEMLQRPRDVVGGVVIMAIGTGFLLVGQELDFGTSFRMGPGYFPTILSIILILMGAALALLALRQPAEEHGFGGIPWRGVVLVIGGTIFFGFALRSLGFIPVLFLLVFATAWASNYARWRTVLPLALGMTLFCWLVFIRGLGLPLPLFGPWVSPATWFPVETPPAATAPAETTPAPAAPAAPAPAAPAAPAQ